MSFTLSALPYGMNALSPYISEETLAYHHGKHHQAYVNKLNDLVAGTPFAHMTLPEVVMQSHGALFNNAAQVWNHDFYWQCLTPNAMPEPKGGLATAIGQAFGSIDQFKAQFTQVALSTFGSGWVWLVKNQQGALEITSTGNADTPMVHGQQALLTCDVWEHAYYIDTRNNRAEYLKNYWQLVHWDFVDQNCTGEKK